MVTILNKDFWHTAQTGRPAEFQGAQQPHRSLLTHSAFRTDEDNLLSCHIKAHLLAQNTSKWLLVMLSKAVLKSFHRNHLLLLLNCYVPSHQHAVREADLRLKNTRQTVMTLSNQSFFIIPVNFKNKYRKKNLHLESYIKHILKCHLKESLASKWERLKIPTQFLFKGVELHHIMQWWSRFSKKYTARALEHRMYWAALCKHNDHTSHLKRSFQWCLLMLHIALTKVLLKSLLKMWVFFLPGIITPKSA